MSDENTYGGRLKRYAQVGSAVGGLAVRLAGERYLGIQVDRTKHAAELKAALGGIKGPLMKIAQILSTIPDALPAEYSRELAQLQNNAPSMSWLFVKRRMSGELGPAWQTRFAHFEHEAAAAASLGQVHRATLPDGTHVAVKLQYPDMAAAVDADLRQLKLAMGIYARYDKAIHPEAIHTELSERLREELDYRREAQHMRLYGHMLRGEDQVHVPVPVDDLTTQRLLVMNWLTGRKILEFTDRSLEERNQLALNLFRAWYIPFYNYGVIHGDPHLGNYMVCDDLSINLLDFGCVRVFRPSFVKGVIDLYHALERDDPDLAVHAYETWGFTGLTKEIIAVLNRWAAFLYGPLLEDRPRKISETGSSDYGRDVAESVHAELGRLGGIAPPREFPLMDRAAIGLGAVFLRLKAEINWHRLFHELIADFSVETMAARQAEALALVGLDPPA